MKINFFLILLFWFFTMMIHCRDLLSPGQTAICRGFLIAVGVFCFYHAVSLVTQFDLHYGKQSLKHYVGKRPLNQNIEY